jgi:hypothetical protein
MALTLSQAQVSAHEDGRDDKRVERSLQGVWHVTITPRVCATGVPIPSAAFQALFTFHADGTLSAWTQNSTISTTRSPSQGLWEFNRRWNNYSLKFVHLRYGLADGRYLGKQVATGMAKLARGGDEFTGEGLTQGLFPNGDEEYAGCSISSGVRLQLND